MIYSVKGSPFFIVSIVIISIVSIKFITFLYGKEFRGYLFWGICKLVNHECWPAAALTIPLILLGWAQQAVPLAFLSCRAAPGELGSTKACLDWQKPFCTPPQTNTTSRLNMYFIGRVFIYFTFLFIFYLLFSVARGGHCGSGTCVTPRTWQPLWLWYMCKSTHVAAIVALVHV